MRRLVTGSRLTLASHFVVLLAIGRSADAQVSSNFIDYALFGNSGVNLQGANVTGGVVGSNGDVTIGAFSTFNALGGGGQLFANGPTVSGNVTFNNDISLGGANVGGAINGGNNISLTPFANTHSITGRDDVTFNGSTASGTILAGNSVNVQGGTITGNVGANFDLMQSGGTINGNVTYGHALLQTGGTITGTKTEAPVSVNPVPFNPVTLPAAIPFTAGGPNLTTGGTLANPLAPGKYGDLNLASFNDLYLVPGNYFFTSLELLHSPTIHLLNLTSQSPINIFVTGDVTFGALNNTTVNGLSFGSADPALAKNVLLETLGQYSESTLGANQFFGSIFAPNGNITFGQFSKLDGSVLSGGQVSTGPGFVQIFEPSQAIIPEPPSLVLYTLGLLGLLGFTWVRRRVVIA